MQWVRFSSTTELVHHRYGRNYYTRYDYESVDSAKADKVMSLLESKMVSICGPSSKCTAMPMRLAHWLCTPDIEAGVRCGSYVTRFAGLRKIYATGPNNAVQEPKDRVSGSVFVYGLVHWRCGRKAGAAVAADA